MEERRKALPLPPEPPRRPRGNRVVVRPVRVCADQGRSGLPRGQQGADQADVRRDELAQPDRDCVRGEVGVEMVVRQLDPRKHQQVVERPCALGLGVDRGEVRGEGPFVDARLGHAPGVVGADDVIGDTENVEAVAAVEIDELAEPKLAIAPRRMGVELAQQRPLHSPDIPILQTAHGNRFGEDPGYLR